MCKLLRSSAPFFGHLKKIILLSLCAGNRNGFCGGIKGFHCVCHTRPHTHIHKHAYVQLCVLNKLLLAFFYSISHYIFISTFLSLSFCNLFFGNSFLAHFYLNFQVVLFARYHCFFVAYSFSALCLMLSTPHLHMYLSGC